jgi:hypothetical protein
MVVPHYPERNYLQYYGKTLNYIFLTPHDFTWRDDGMFLIYLYRQIFNAN